MKPLSHSPARPSSAHQPIRSRFAPGLALALALGLGASACTRSDRPVAALPSGAAYEELTEAVPPHFSEADKWNRKDICPEGSTLSPLTRYAYGPGQKNYGFTHYYGRSCNVVTSREPEGSVRAIASPKAGAYESSMALQPNGPFIWWYESGKRMSAGNFDHGTLASDWSRWEPDGSLAAK